MINSNSHERCARLESHCSKSATTDRPSPGAKHWPQVVCTSAVIDITLSGPGKSAVNPDSLRQCDRRKADRHCLAKNIP